MSLNSPSLSPRLLDEELDRYRQAPRWLVAYSGGVDSLVLLRMLAELPNAPPLVAVHINHQLQAEANRWEQHCRQQAESLGIEFYCQRVQLESVANIEEAARRARYQVFESILGAGEVLLMAHHLDDQMETLLLRMLRGSGSRGLAAIPASRPLGRGVLLRPLLHVARAELEDCARQRGWEWVEDPSNRSLAFDRNYLRSEVLPLIQQRWPDYRRTFERVIALSEEAEQLNQELAELDCHALNLVPDAESLSLAMLRELTPARLKNVLRYWLQSRDLPLPTAAQLQVLITEVMGASPDAEPLLEWPGVQVRRYRDDIFAMQPLAEIDMSMAICLEGERSGPIPGCGEVVLEQAMGSGIRADILESGPITLRFRQGGERCRPAGRQGSRSLKKLMQEFGIETWMRDRVPLLYCNGELVAVADYWVCDGFAAAAGQRGFRCHWRRQPQLKKE